MVVTCKMLHSNSSNESRNFPWT